MRLVPELSEGRLQNPRRPRALIGAVLTPRAPANALSLPSQATSAPLLRA